MKKISKKKKNFLIFGVIILGIIIIAIIGFSNNLSIIFFSPSLQTLSYGTPIDNGNSVTYSLAFSNPGGYVGVCQNTLPNSDSTAAPIHFNGNLPFRIGTSGTPTLWEAAKFIPNTQQGINFNTTNIILSTSNMAIGTGGHCGNTNYRVEIVNKTASCNVNAVDNGPTSGIKAALNCIVDADIVIEDSNGNIVPTDTASLYGWIDGGTIKVEIPKTGIKCTPTQTTLCGNNMDCINNQCVAKTIDVYRLSNNMCNFITINYDQRLISDYDTLNLCQKYVIPNAPYPSPPSSQSWVNSILDWINNAWQWLKSHFTFSIVGIQNVTVGQQVSYLISEYSPAPNSCTGFTTSCGYQWGNWFLTDSNNNLINSGTPQLLINGTYITNVTFNAPSNPGGYVLTGSIWEIDYSYSSQSLSWNVVKNGSVANETYGLLSQTPYLSTPSAPPSSSWIKNILNVIAEFFNTIFKKLGF